MGKINTKGGGMRGEKLVYLVEDDEQVALASKLWLTLAGASVTYFKDGESAQAALIQLKKAGRINDAWLVSDQDLSGLMGSELIQWAISQGVSPDRIMFASSYSPAETEGVGKRVREMGVNMVRKPYDGATVFADFLNRNR